MLEIITDAFVYTLNMDITVARKWNTEENFWDYILARLYHRHTIKVSVRRYQTSALLSRDRLANSDFCPKPQIHLTNRHPTTYAATRKPSYLPIGLHTSSPTCIPTYRIPSYPPTDVRKNRTNYRRTYPHNDLLIYTPPNAFTYIPIKLRG